MAIGEKRTGKYAEGSDRGLILRQYLGIFRGTL
jgi:hypothetical protein